MNHTKKQITKQFKDSRKTLQNKGSIISQFLKSDATQILLDNLGGVRHRIFTPLITLNMFIRQVLSPDKSCRNAVAIFRAEQCAQQEQMSSASTGAYCKARKRLLTEVIQDLSLLVHKAITRESFANINLYKGRAIIVADGTTLTMPDTEENQLKWPQHGNQEIGIGFPIIRMVALQSISTGAVLGHAIAPHKGKETGEHALLRTLFHLIKCNDIFLGDRYYPSFFHMADIRAQEADGLYQAAAQRKIDFRRGVKLGEKDHIVEWIKPKVKPKYMPQEKYDSYPEIMRVREFNCKGTRYVTTLLDNKQNRKKELVNLYKLRWRIETCFAETKNTLQMGILSCKTPAMICKEIAIHFLAYNLVRMQMFQAAAFYSLDPLRLSFKGTLQYTNNFTALLINCVKSVFNQVLAEMYKCIAGEIVSERPGRTEPREVKRRCKPHKKMNKSRSILRKELIKKQAKRTAEA
jgi:hypothetical protein